MVYKCFGPSAMVGTVCCECSVEAAVKHVEIVVVWLTSTDTFYCVNFASMAYAVIQYPSFLQCFDAVGWVAGRASGL